MSFPLFTISHKSGAYPDLKFPTVMSRLVQSQVQPAQLFFRTSPASRSSGRFLNENRILPPLACSTCIKTLESIRKETKAVDIHFADEEGDSYAVELAGRLGGYVISKDSDFVIFNTDGYKGYVPIDEMTWMVSLTSNEAPVDRDDDDFQKVRKNKSKRKTMTEQQASQGLVPPETGNNLSLSFVSYNPQTLADHLAVPVALLPLLGALVGNDFSKECEVNSRKIQSLFFSRHLTLSQRIEQAANTLRSVISPQKRKATLQVGSVMDLIEKTVNALLSRLSPNLGLSSGDIESIIDKIVNATLQYAIPKHEESSAGLWTNTVCALHDSETCSILPIISRNVMRQAQESKRAGRDLLRARELYLDAYRGGLLSARNMDILNTGSSWAGLFLENPDLETVAQSIGRPIRMWIHSILDDTVGLVVQSSEAAETENNTSDDDELIDVVESDSERSPIDYLAPLKGELERLHCSNDEANDPPSPIISHRRLDVSPPCVTEYFRSGTRIASEEVVVKPILELLSSISLPEYGENEAPPVVLRSEDDRFTVLLRVLKSDLLSIRSLSPETILPVLAVRWVVHSLHSRFLQTGSREREKERWTKYEVLCFLSSFFWEMESSETEREYPTSIPIENRNVQLMAQLSMALETIEQLSQVLLLTRRIKSNFRRFSGKRFHAYLTRTIPLEMKLPCGVWEGAETDLAHAFQEELKQQQKTKAKKSSTPAVANAKRSVGNNKGSFALLSDLEL